MLKRRQQDSPNCLAHKAVKLLPKKYRAEYLAVWLAELEAIESQEARLEYAQGLKVAARQTRRELDPEDALVTDLIRWVAVVEVFLHLLVPLHSLTNMNLLATTLPYMLGVLLLTNLSTRAILCIPELKNVLWRKALMIVIAFVCGYFALAFLTWRSATYPSTFLLLVASAIAGNHIARYYHQPRPILER